MGERDVATTENRPLGATPAAWWGEFSFEKQTWGHWRIGPLFLWVQRTEHDWQIAFAREDDPFDEQSGVQLPADPERTPIPADAARHRVAYANTSETLELRPMLADRPVVARPETTFSVPPREKVSVFVSSAVWVRLSCGPRKDRLLEIPTWRPSDTWFGNNLAGFLCYATRTAMRLEVGDLQTKPHRAVTTVVIDNKGNDTLSIDRISLPVPNLSVFATPAGALWTERVLLTRKDDAEMAHVHIEKEKPPQPGAARLCGPRTVSEDNLISRVFTGLFG